MKLTDHTWAHVFNIKEDIFIKWQEEKASDSFLFWALKNEYVATSSYFEWAKNHYQIPKIKDSFLKNYTMSKEKWQKIEKLEDWRKEFAPIWEAKNTLYVACLAPPVKDNNKNFRFVLATPSFLEAHWKKVNSFEELKATSLPEEDVSTRRAPDEIDQPERANAEPILELKATSLPEEDISTRRAPDEIDQPERVNTEPILELKTTSLPEEDVSTRRAPDEIDQPERANAEPILELKTPQTMETEAVLEIDMEAEPLLELKATSLPEEDVSTRRAPDEIDQPERANAEPLLELKTPQAMKTETVLEIDMEAEPLLELKATSLPEEDVSTRRAPDEIDQPERANAEPLLELKTPQAMETEAVSKINIDAEPILELKATSLPEEDVSTRRAPDEIDQPERANAEPILELKTPQTMETEAVLEIDMEAEPLLELKTTSLPEEDVSTRRAPDEIDQPERANAEPLLELKTPQTMETEAVSKINIEAENTACVKVPAVGINSYKYFEKLNDFFKSVVILEVQSDAFIPLDGKNLNFKKSIPIPYEPKNFLQVTKRGHVYNGFVINNEVNKRFFESLGCFTFPKYVSAIPIQDEKRQTNKIVLGISNKLISGNDAKEIESLSIAQFKKATVKAAA